MLAKSEKPRSATVGIRYYLWSADGPRRLTQRVHHELIEGLFSLPQYADSRQKILEVFVTHQTKTHFILNARGILYPFDTQGFFDDRKYLQFVLPDVRGFRTSKQLSLSHASAKSGLSASALRNRSLALSLSSITLTKVAMRLDKYLRGKWCRCLFAARAGDHFAFDGNSCSLNQE